MSIDATQDDLHELIREVINRIAVGPNRGKNIDRTQAQAVMEAITSGGTDAVQAAIILIGLRMKGESLEELTGMFSALQGSISQHKVEVPELFCLADPFDGYLRYVPVSPFVPATLAAAGLPVVVTGVESVGPKHGVTAHKVFRQAGINVDHTTHTAAQQIESSGWCYLDQSRFAQALYSLAQLREKMVKRTALTTLERLLNPLRGAQHTHLILGYVHKAYPAIYSHLAQQAGFDTALLVKGVEGGIAPALNKPLKSSFYSFNKNSAAVVKQEVPVPAVEFALQYAGEQYSQQGDIQEGARVGQCLESGLGALRGVSGDARNSLVLACAQILFHHRPAVSFPAAVELIQHCLDNGSALRRFHANAGTVDQLNKT